MKKKKKGTKLRPEPRPRDIYPELVAQYEKAGIETDVNIRWEKGTDHHPKSEDLMEHLMGIDFVFVDDHFCWKKGGDGDNGEALMYEMDMYFELMDIEGKLT